jgi:hypothetical protein
VHASVHLINTKGVDFSRLTGNFGDQSLRCLIAISPLQLKPLILFSFFLLRVRCNNLITEGTNVDYARSVALKVQHTQRLRKRFATTQTPGVSR